MKLSGVFLCICEVMHLFTSLSYTRCQFHCFRMPNLLSGKPRLVKFFLVLIAAFSITSLLPVHAAIPGVKYIQIRSAASTSNQIVQLAEVVARRESDNTDVATSAASASATVVETYSANTSLYGVSKAIDGATDPGRDSLRNYYHSGTGAGQLVTVTLQNVESLSSLTLVGRADCCSNRDVYDVTLLGSTGGALASFSGLNANNGSNSVTVQLSEQQPGSNWQVEAVDGNTTIDSIADALQWLNNPGNAPRQVALLPTVNISDNGNRGHFSGDTLFDYSNDFAVRATRHFSIDTAGDYSFGLNSDDGARIYINGDVLVNDDVLRAPADSIGSLFLPAGRHTIEVIHFERGGGAALEIWAAGGVHPFFNSEFELMQGSVGAGTDPVDLASTEGLWGPVLDWPLVSVSMANLPDGRILSYSGSERRTWPTTEQTYSVVWDPASGTFDEMLHVGHNMFCAATSMTSDGQVFVNGGRNQSNSPWTSIFDYQSGTWTQIENMASGGRWYPTTLALGNGNIFTGMGVSTNVRNPDLWNPDTGWRVLNGIDFLALRQNHNENGRENVFPLLSQAPNGSIYHFWDTSENHFLSTDGNGAATLANADTDRGDHAGGIQVMYDEGELLISGQNDGSWGGNSSVVTNNAFTVDLNAAAPVIRSSGAMTSARKFHQMIPLPTGEVLVVGGNTTGAKFADNGSVMHAEIWNPDSRRFRRAATMSVPRDYHSTALLLLDGRVITAGGGYHPSDPNSAGTHQDAQIYSPPYLFNTNGELASRPSVNSVSEEVDNGQQFTVNTSGDIAYFSLIKMSSTTHAINTDVRHFRPTFTANGANQYLIAMHENPNVAIAGYWMLFAVDNAGVPSVADVIKVRLESNNGGGGSAPVVVPVTSSAVQTGTSQNYSVSATGGSLTYSWNFGDGGGDTAFSTSSSISHNYASPGRYVVTVTVRDEFGNETTESFTQMVHRPLLAGKPTASSGLAELPTRNEVFAVNPDNDSVSVISTSSLSRTAEIPVGDEPRALAVAPDGRVWVVNKAAATISIINPGTRQVVQTVSLDSGSLPHGIVMGNSSAYVALQGLATVVQLNASNGSEQRRAFAGETPRHLSLNAAANRLYVSAFITPPIPNEHTVAPDVANGGAEVRAFSTSSSTLSLQRLIRLGYSNRDISEHSGPGMPNYLGAAVVSPDGTAAWVTSKQDNVLGGTLRSPAGLNFDQGVRAITSMIDLGSESEVLSNRVDHDNASIGSHGAFGPNGLLFFTSLEGNRQIAMIDTMTAIEIARFDSGRAPQSVLVSSDGSQLYVHNFMGRSVSVYDIDGAVDSGETEVSELARVTTVSNETLASNVLLGKQHFYDARDDRLASLDYMSCASCHNEAGHDGRTWDFTGFGEGLRNTISLQGTGGMTNGLLHWSANFDELQDFEGQIREFAGGSGLMPDSSFFAGSRSTPLGDSKAGQSADLDALASYLASLDLTPASPYRQTNGSMDASAELGRTRFAEKGCVDCHSGDRFTDSTLTANPHNVGTLDTASGSRLGGALTGIDTPTLLGVWHTAPYLHDGSAQTVEDAINAHSTISLTNTELAELSAYVRQLSSNDLPPTDGGGGGGEVSPVTLAASSLSGNGTTDGWKSNMVIDLQNTYRNTSGADQQFSVDAFSFYANRRSNPVTPFIVRVNGSNSFTVLAIGSTRTSYSSGSNEFAFGDSANFVVPDGVTIAAGFIDAFANGSGGGSKAAVTYLDGGSSWRTGGSRSRDAGAVVQGQAPIEGRRTRTQARTYQFSITLQPAP